MRVELKVPELPEGISEAFVATVHKRLGESVSCGEVVVDVETDKVVLEIEATVDGVLAELPFHEGDAVVANQCVAIVRMNDSASRENELGSPFGHLPAVQESVLSSLTDRVNGMTGLERAKRELLETIALIRVMRKRLDAGIGSGMASFHAVFSGNPGTGKTTFARIYAAALKALGIITKDQVVEVGRADLVGGYLGQTALKTREVIDSAMGGCLFIDEAYALVTDDRDAYGREALAELIKVMEDHRAEFVVILAGYSEEMKGLIAVNPGLKSRILSTVHFEDYDAGQLVAIARSIAGDKKYELELEVERELKQYFEDTKTAAESRTFGNAREARNVVELMIRAHAVRLASVEEPTLQQLVCLDLDDLRAAMLRRC